MITDISLEQAEQIPHYREKWRQIALSTQPVDRQKAVEAILYAYAIAGIRCPKIIFCDSPYAAFQYTNQEPPSFGRPSRLLGEKVDTTLENQIRGYLWGQVTGQITEDVVQDLRRMNRPENEQLLCNLPRMSVGLWSKLSQQQGGSRQQSLFDGGAFPGSFDIPFLPGFFDEITSNSLIDPMQWATTNGSFLDYCISVLDCTCDETVWTIFQDLIQACGWILPYRHVCLVCDRPREISFDGNRPVYTVGEATIRYADGFVIRGLVEGHPAPKSSDCTIPEQSHWVELPIQETDELQRLVSVLHHELTLDQEALLVVYHEKWKARILQTGRLEQQQATEAIHRAYGVIGQPVPKIVFCDNPYAAQVNYVSQWNEAEFGEHLYGRTTRLLWSDLEGSLTRQVGFELNQRLVSELNKRLERLYFNCGGADFMRWLASCFETVDLGWYVNPSWWACGGAYLDFCINVLSCSHDAETWQAFQAIVDECGWVFPYAKVCYVCDRPIRLRAFQEDPSTEKEPLIEFADGLRLFMTSEGGYVSSFDAQTE